MFSPKKNKKRFFAGAYWGSYIREERGFVLVLTLMLISLMSVLAITSFELVTSTTRITSNHKLYLQALYVADAGVEDTLCVLSKADWNSLVFDPETQSSLSTLLLDSIDPNWTWDSANNKWLLSKSDLGGTYTVTLTMNAGASGDTSDDRLRLESTGTISGLTKVIIAEIGKVPSTKITLWMEKDNKEI